MTVSGLFDDDDWEETSWSQCHHCHDFFDLTERDDRVCPVCHTGLVPCQR